MLPFLRASRLRIVHCVRISQGLGRRISGGHEAVLEEACPSFFQPPLSRYMRPQAVAREAACQEDKKEKDEESSEHGAASGYESAR